MNRRSFLTLLASVPGLGWVKPEPLTPLEIQFYPIDDWQSSLMEQLPDRFVPWTGTISGAFNADESGGKARLFVNGVERSLPAEIEEGDSIDIHFD